MPDPGPKRLLYIALLGIGAILPLWIGIYPINTFFASISVWCVAWYIRCDRNRARDRRGFPVILLGRQFRDQTS